MKTMYEDKDLLVIEKPAGIDIAQLEKELPKQYPQLKKVERSGIIHRLDKETSGILLVAKSQEALIFFQKQFKNRMVEKKYIVLAVGKIKENRGKIETLIGRSKKDGKKQKVFLKTEPNVEGKREAITEYNVLKRYKDYTLLEVAIKTGRKHQIRCHLAYIGHPVAGDKVYGFKNQPCPEGLNRQFLHAEHIKIKLLNGSYKEFELGLTEDLQKAINNL